MKLNITLWLEMVLLKIYYLLRVSYSGTFIVQTKNKELQVSYHHKARYIFLKVYSGYHVTCGVGEQAAATFYVVKLEYRAM